MQKKLEISLTIKSSISLQNFFVQEYFRNFWKEIRLPSKLIRSLASQQKSYNSALLHKEGYNIKPFSKNLQFKNLSYPCLLPDHNFKIIKFKKILQAIKKSFKFHSLLFDSLHQV